LTDPVHPAPADAEGDNPAPLVDRPAAAAAVEAETGDLAMELFHRVNRVLPEDQALVSVEPETSAREAIAIMTQRGFSQLPVVSAGRVLGIFSFRSYVVGTAALSLADLNGQRIAPGDLRVDELLEQMQFARVADEIDDLFDAMDRDNGLVVGTADNAIGILTPMDFLRYLHRLSAPFVYLSEIELALRAIIRHAVTPELLVEVATASLAQHFDPEPPPTVLEEMSFDNYATMLGYGATWGHFEAAMGTSRQRLAGKLKHIRDLRNDVFHFKRELSVQEIGNLRTYRHWLLAKVEQFGRGQGRGEP